MILPPPPPVPPCLVQPSAARSEAGLALIAWEDQIARHAADRRYEPEPAHASAASDGSGDTSRTSAESPDDAGLLLDAAYVSPPPERRFTVRARVRVRPAGPPPPVTDQPLIEV